MSFIDSFCSHFINERDALGCFSRYFSHSDKLRGIQICGPSGSGRSELLEWIKDQIPHPELKVFVKLEAHTSSEDVIDEIHSDLEAFGLDIPEYDLAGEDFFKPVVNAINQGLHLSGEGLSVVARVEAAQQNSGQVPHDRSDVRKFIAAKKSKLVYDALLQDKTGIKTVLLFDNMDRSDDQTREFIFKHIVRRIGRLENTRVAFSSVTEDRAVSPSSNIHLACPFETIILRGECEPEDIAAYLRDKATILRDEEQILEMSRNLHKVGERKSARIADLSRPLLLGDSSK